MRYLCLIYHDKRALASLPPSERDALAGEAREYDEALRRSGHVIASSGSGCAPTAAAIRVEQGRIAVTEGPCSEAQGRPGGFALIEARDLNEAIRVAAGLPTARLGCVEVWPVGGWHSRPGG